MKVSMWIIFISPNASFLKFVGNWSKQGSLLSQPLEWTKAANVIPRGDMGHFSLAHGDFEQVAGYQWNTNDHSLIHCLNFRDALKGGSYLQVAWTLQSWWFCTTIKYELLWFPMVVEFTHQRPHFAQGNRDLCLSISAIVSASCLSRNGRPLWRN